MKVFIFKKIRGGRTLKSILLALLLGVTLNANAQNIITIGEGTELTSSLPFEMEFNYSITEQIYDPEEIGSSGTITSIAFYYDYTEAFSSDDMKVFMKNVTRSVFADENDIEPLSPSDLVWTGTFAATEPGWVTINLDTPFQYDGTSHLLVACFDGTEGYPGLEHQFRVYRCAETKGILWEEEDPILDPYNLGGYSMFRFVLNVRNNIQLSITGNMSFSFDGGTLQGWTTIDADGDGFNFELTTSGVHGGSHAVMSKSWDENAGALTPDNYLVSPTKLQYSQISFWAVGLHPSWPEEHFGVAVSTAGNSDPSDFTTIAEWTATNEYTEYTADLSAYAGQEIWVAIRHFDCTDQFALNVDDITLTVDDNPNPVQTITEINLGGFTVPEWGAHPDYDLTVPEGAPYAVSEVNWKKYTGDMTPQSVFDDENDFYYMRVLLTPDEGYAFDPDATVYFNGDASICDAGYNLVLNNGDFRIFTVDFQVTSPIPSTYTVTATANPMAGGTVSGGGTFLSGETCTLTATAANGYQFLNWTKNGAQVSSSAVYNFTVTETAQYVANFIQSQTQTYTLTVSCDPTMGAVTGNGTYAAGTQIIVEAIAYKDYVFDSWNDGVTDNPRTVTINGNLSLVAFFKGTGVDEHAATALRAYPNPAGESLRIEGLKTDATVEIYNIVGSLVKTVNVTPDQEINVGELSKGLYLLRCGQQTLRFVKE